MRPGEGDLDRAGCDCSAVVRTGIAVVRERRCTDDRSIYLASDGTLRALMDQIPNVRVEKAG